MIPRTAQPHLTQAFKVNPVVGLLGPRQSGKSTLARAFARRQKGPVTIFDLEDPADSERLRNPDLALGDLDGLIIIDEIQRTPRLFEYLRVLVDRRKRAVRVLILGSASRDLVQRGSESLAGRISYVELAPFGLQELPRPDLLHLRGGFPLSALARSESISHRWRQDYVATFLERDLFDFGLRIPPGTIRRFWLMLSHYHGQILNYSELGRSFGISDVTVRKYLDLLQDTFMIRLLQPWHENLAKRQVKAPKVYFRDSGILHALLGIGDRQALLRHPKLGASWEGFALEQVIQRHTHHASGVAPDFYFWSTHSQTELDLLVMENGKRIGYEFKYSDAPRLTASLNIARDDLKLDSLHVITPKGTTHRLGDRIWSGNLSGGLGRI